MYTIVERRRINSDRMPETNERAQKEFFPKMQQAPGFVGFYLTADTAEHTYVGVTVWESREHAEAFRPTAELWLNELTQLGHTMETTNQGETVVRLER